MSGLYTISSFPRRRESRADRLNPQSSRGRLRATEKDQGNKKPYPGQGTAGEVGCHTVLAFPTPALPGSGSKGRPVSGLSASRLPRLCERYNTAEKARKSTVFPWPAACQWSRHADRVRQKQVHHHHMRDHDHAPQPKLIILCLTKKIAFRTILLHTACRRDIPLYQCISESSVEFVTIREAP
jgi:hypothetical protein